MVQLVITMKVSIQGLRGSFHDIAAQHYFGKDYVPVCRRDFREVFWDMAHGHVDHAFISLENSLYGSINQVYDLLLEHEKLWISGEIYMRIKHCLIGTKKAKLEDLREVHSHPIALAQCEQFLEEEIPYAERYANSDTAGSVAAIKVWNDPTKAAIASEEAARHYGMKILRYGIETQHENYTRFVVLSQEKFVSQDADRTSFVLTSLAGGPDWDLKSGTLQQTLNCFAERNINLTKIESRRVVGSKWRYIFYLDFELGLDNPLAGDALSCLENLGAEVHVLGSYKAGEQVHN